MKTIKIVEQGFKQVAVRVSEDVYVKLQSLAKSHKTSLQEIVRYILQEEINNYN